MNVTVLVDDEKSWFVPYGKKLVENLKKNAMNACMIHDKKEASGGDISFLLSCTKLVGRDFLQKYRHNIVIHASDLPQGKGFTPLKWQILEGKDHIVLTMFEAVEAVDAGPYYRKEKLFFKGTELLDELQRAMAEQIICMCVEYALNPDRYVPTDQTGQESFYKRFQKEDDRLDIDKTIREQINHFRIADNEHFPLWFSYKDCRYIVKIYRDGEEE